MDCYRVHPNVQLVTDPVIMPAKEEHGCDSGSESLDKHEPRDILHRHVERRVSIMSSLSFVKMRNYVTLELIIQQEITYITTNN